MIDNKGFKISQYACAVLLIVSSIALVSYQVVEILQIKTKWQGRIAHHLYVSAAMPPFRTSWLYLVSPFTMQR